jgi:putative transposase
MNTRKIAVEYRLSHWAEIMRERQESGLSIKAFCEARGFHQNIYFYWQRKLREAACQNLLPTAQTESKTAVVPSGWAVCEAEVTKSESQSAVAIEIVKCRITATADTDEETLVKVCRAMMSLC